jgi:hypothetical protein
MRSGALIRKVLSVDADRFERQITPVIGQYSIGGTETLWSRIETVATAYRLHGAINGRRPRRDKLVALRKSAEKLQTRIIDAIAVPVGTKGDPLVHPVPLDGVDADMLPATRHYFSELLRTLDRQLKLAGSRRDSARKTAREKVWEELLAIWCELGGKPRRRAAARFLIAASKPVSAPRRSVKASRRSLEKEIKAAEKWLERRSSKSVNKASRGSVVEPRDKGSHRLASQFATNKP